MRNLLLNTLKVGGSLVLGGAILYWMYRDFDFGSISHVLLHEMNWTWMLLSLPFGIMAQVFRAWRWQMALEPLGQRVRTSTAVHAVFLSYASSLVIPRIGEFTRCGVLKRYDRVSFAKALGTVVTERAIDTAIVLLIAGSTMLWQAPVFVNFFKKTGNNVEHWLNKFSSTGYLVTAICTAAVGVLLWWLLKKLAIYNKVKEKFKELMAGVASVGKIKQPTKFVVYSLAIWVSYFLHFFLTFYCFEATTHLSVGCICVTFVVGSIAVIVPTPNGAGSWHFAVKTMLCIYGVAATQALYFVLIVHTVQTLLVILVGIYAWLALAFTKPREMEQQKNR